MQLLNLVVKAFKFNFNTHGKQTNKQMFVKDLDTMARQRKLAKAQSNC